MVSPASGDLPNTFVNPVFTDSMFPFNWFPQRVGTRLEQAVEAQEEIVSIQLVSPASGDYIYRISIKTGLFGFPFNWFPQRVGTAQAVAVVALASRLFPFNWFPQRVGTVAEMMRARFTPEVFPFNWFPQRVGTH